MPFITPAFAQTAAPAAPDMIMQLVLPFGFMLLIMYFLYLRPQQQREKTQRDMLAAIRRGDVVVMGGGLIGKVVKTIDDSELELEIAPNTRIRVMRKSVASVRTKGEPVKDA